LNLFIQETAIQTVVIRTGTIQFITTPRGRRKLLGQLRKTFDSNDKKLTAIEFLFDGTKTRQEQKKLLDFLVKEMSFNVTTTWTLKLPFVLGR